MTGKKMTSTETIFVGTAAWNLPKEYRAEFPTAASILESYAQRLPAVEINSSFYRHHQARLELDSIANSHFRKVMQDYQALGTKFGCLLVQLPPSLEWNRTLRSFFSLLRDCYPGAVALEPRHVGWTGAAAQEMLREFRVARVWADPTPIPNPLVPDFESGATAYFRLHGSPEIYKSSYDAAQLKFYRTQLQIAAQTVTQVWCIFDNSAHGFATANALELTRY